MKIALVAAKFLLVCAALAVPARETWAASEASNGGGGAPVTPFGTGPIDHDTVMTYYDGATMCGTGQEGADWGPCPSGSDCVPYPGGGSVCDGGGGTGGGGSGGGGSGGGGSGGGGSGGGGTGGGGSGGGGSGGGGSGGGGSGGGGSGGGGSGGSGGLYLRK